MKRFSIDERVAERTDQIFTKNNLSRLKEKELNGVYGKDKTSVPEKLSVLLFGFIQNTPVIPQLRKELESMGINLEILAPNSDKEAFEIFQKGTYDLIYLYSGVTALDPLVELIYLFNHRVVNLDYRNTHLVNLLDRAKKETDRKKYISLLKDIHLKLIEEYRVLPLMHTKMVYSAKGDYYLKDLSYFDGGLNLWDWRKK